MVFLKKLDVCVLSAGGLHIRHRDTATSPDAISVNGRGLHGVAGKEGFFLFRHYSWQRLMGRPKYVTRCRVSSYVLCLFDEPARRCGVVV